MKSIKNYVIISTCFYSILFCTRLNGITLHWPTEYPFLEKGEPFLQGTLADNPISGSFGCVRNNGKKFHEGIDIKCTRRNKNGEPLDAIHSILPGTVAHINPIEGNSTYGKYIVLEHSNYEPAIYSLYAHLSKIDERLKINCPVQAGQKLGVMGRSAFSYTIPKDRAHLHLEMGLMLTDNFETWYKHANFSSKNLHKNWNGMNLIGFDPWHCFQEMKNKNWNAFNTYLQNLPIAFQLRVLAPFVPNFVKRYPCLLTKSLETTKITGWEIGFTWYGLPIRWTPLYKKLNKKTEIIAYNSNFYKEMNTKKMIIQEGKNKKIGKNLQTTLDLLFKYK